VPTIAESGYAGFEIYDWEGLLAPSGTPPTVIAKLNAEVNRIVTAPEVKQRIADMCAHALGGTPTELGQRIVREIALWHHVVKQSGMAVD